MAYAIRTSKKKKGANKGYKYTYQVEWSGKITRSEYLRRLTEIDRREAGLFLCKLEQNDFNEDRFWDTPDYRETAIKDFRDRIKGIRTRYGLTQKECLPFMRVEAV